MAEASASDLGSLDPFISRLFHGEDSQDEIDFIETFLSIDSEAGRVVKFQLYPQQRMMAQGSTGRDITVKGRQTRASSYILARNLRRMITHGGLKCLVMTQDDQTTATFRARIKHHLRDLKNKGYDFMAQKGLDNENELVLDNDSRYMFGSGEERTAGRAYCVTPETRILTGDLRWIPAGELSVGEELLGFDEESSPYRGGGRPRRCYQQAKVLSAERRILPVYEIELETGEILRATDEHRWLVEPTSRNGASWRGTDELYQASSPQYLLRYLPTWEAGKDWDAGLLAGAFDADGTISRGDGSSPLARFTQYQNSLLSQVQSSLSTFGFLHSFHEGKGTSEPQYNVVVQGGYAETLRFLGTIRPPKLLHDWRRFDVSHRTLQRIQKVRVIEVRYAGHQEVVALSSSSQTYFAEGFASHNTGHIVHLSEFAHWPPERTGVLIGGVQPSVPGPPYGWIDIESTPNGAEGTFYEMVTSSRLYDPMSRWTAHFYSWWLEPRYRAGSIEGNDILFPENEWEALLHDFRPTQEEEKLMEEAGLDVGQIIWRRIKKKEQDKTDAPFLQEYPESLEGCFLTAGGNYFASPDGVNHLEKYRHTIGPPKEILDSIPFRNGTTSFNGQNLYIWQKPQSGRPYVVWVDCAGGGLGEDSDFSAVVVLDAAERFVAARLAVKVAPQELAPMAVALASWYNNALLGGERDAFGSVCLDNIQKLFYRNLWYYIEPGANLKINSAPQDPWGHPTAIRNHILSSLRESVFAGTFHTSDSWMVQQMGAFVWSKVAGREKLKAAGKKGYKDDLVMSAAGCVYIAPLGSARYNANRGQVGPESRPLQENEVVVVGRHGLVQNRYVSGKRGQSPSPWLR